MQHWMAWAARTWRCCVEHLEVVGGAGSGVSIWCASSGGVRAPSWSQPGDAAGEVRDHAAAVVDQDLQVRVALEHPEKTIRAMNAAVSYSQPNTHQISYFETSSVG